MCQLAVRKYSVVVKTTLHPTTVDDTTAKKPRSLTFPKDLSAASHAEFFYVMHAIYNAESGGGWKYEIDAYLLMLALDAIPGALRTGRKTFDTQDHSAAVLKPAADQKKCMS